MQYLQRGQTFARTTIAKAATSDARAALAFAATRWGSQSGPALELKAAIAGGATDDADYVGLVGTANEAASEFLDMVSQLDLIGRLGLRRVPPGVPVVAGSSGATAYWVGQSKAVPVSRQAFERISMYSKRLAALVVVSNELLQSADPRAEALFLRDLIRAAVALSDSSFIDPAGTASATTPASITAGVTPISSTGDLADDVEAAIEAFTGNLLTASWVCHPRTAAQAGIRAGTGGAGADLGAKGGTLAGLSVTTSEGVPYDSSGGLLVLLDAANIALVDEGFDTQRSTVGTIEQSDTPTGATDTPASMTTLVSLFSTDSTAIKLTRSINWTAAPGAGVVVVEGCNYGAAP